MTPIPDPRPDPRPSPDRVFVPNPLPPGVAPALAVEPDGEPVSGQHLESDGAELGRVAEPRERQAVDVRPMYYVLGAGLAGAVIGMILTFALV